MTGDSNEQLPPWTEGLLGQRASILSQQHPIPSTASQGRGGPINAVVSTQRTCYPVHQHGNSQSLLSSLDESDPIVSMLALHIALQQQLDTISSNRRSDHLAAIINTQASSPVADSRSMITNPLTSQLAAVLSSPIPTLTSPQRLGISPNISVSSRLQQILNDGTPVRATNLAVAQSSTVEHPLYSSAALATIAAMMLQDGDGCGALTHTPHGTAAQRSSMSASTGTSSTNRREADSMRAVVVGVPQNEASLPTVGMARPLPALPTLQHHALLPFFLQDPTILAALPAAMSIPGGGRMPQAHLPTPLRLPLADSRGSSLSLRGPLGHFVEHRKLPRIIHVPSDDDSLSPYQCLVRKQIQLFEASEADINATAQGRNRPIIVGQVGIRCIHCGRLPIERRARGAVYFPSTLMSTYQTAQNMANSHLMKDCREIPKCIRDALIRVRLRENSESQNTRKSAFGGGRAYWARGLQMNHGVIETDDRRLKFGSF